MKVEVLKEEAKPVFESIKLELTIENKEELLELWCLLGLSVDGINKLIEEEAFSIFRIDESTTMKLWGILSDIVDNRDVDP